jgi:putative membrane protein
MKLLIKLFLNIFTLWIVSYIVPGFEFDSTQALVVTAVVVGVVNTFIKPVLQIIFIPISIITFGVTAFLINVVLLWGVSFIVPGFEIINFWTAVISSVLLSLVSLFLNKLSQEKKDLD